MSFMKSSIYFFTFPVLAEHSTSLTVASPTDAADRIRVPVSKSQGTARCESDTPAKQISGQLVFLAPQVNTLPTTSTPGNIQWILLPTSSIASSGTSENMQSAQMEKNVQAIAKPPPDVLPQPTETKATSESNQLSGPQ